MNTVKVSALVTVLIRDEPVLIENWKAFYFTLDHLDTNALVPLDSQWKTSSIKTHDLFFEIIKSWVTKAGSNANIGQLLEILGQNGYTNAVERLRVHYAKRLENGQVVTMSEIDEGKWLKDMVIKV